MRIYGLIIAAISVVFIVISLLLSISDYADLHGWDGIKRVVDSIFRATQYPVLSTVWSMAAHVDLRDFMQLRNVGFFFEVVIFLAGAATVSIANGRLLTIANAEQEAIQELRRQQFKEKQQEKMDEQQRR
jgi:hypothetical protein